MRPGPSRIGKLAAIAMATVLLAGCSQLPAYPSLPIGDVIGQKTLTPEQQDAEIKDLSEAQVENTAQADSSKPPEYLPASTSETE